MAEKKNTTIAIAQDVNARLELLCTSLGIKKKDFIGVSVEYFQRTGIDPRTDAREESNQAIADQLKIISAQLQSTREDTHLAKRQNETLFGLVKGLNEGLQAVASKQDEQQQATQLIVQQTKKKRHWWQRKEKDDEDD